jgi:deoxyribose-phosphate aldolase
MHQDITLHSLARMIDHSLLHPTMTDADILNGCEIAKKYDVATVCIKPYAIEMCKIFLKGTDVGICSVVTFPHGNSYSRNSGRSENKGTTIKKKLLS